MFSHCKCITSILITMKYICSRHSSEMTEILLLSRQMSISRMTDHESLRYISTEFSSEVNRLRLREVSDQQRPLRVTYKNEFCVSLGATSHTMKFSKIVIEQRIEFSPIVILEIRHYTWLINSVFISCNRVEMNRFQSFH